MPPAEILALAMAARVFHTGLLDQRDAGDIGWSAVPLGRLHGDAMAAALDRAGVEVMLTTPVDNVVRTTDGFATHTPERVLDADQVVVATPHDVTARLLPAGLAPDTTPLGYSPIVNVHLVLDRRVTDLPMAAAIDLKTPNPSVLPSSASAQRSGCGIMMVTSETPGTSEACVRSSSSSRASGTSGCVVSTRTGRYDVAIAMTS